VRLFELQDNTEKLNPGNLERNESCCLVLPAAPCVQLARKKFLVANCAIPPPPFFADVRHFVGPFISAAHGWYGAGQCGHSVIASIGNAVEPKGAQRLARLLLLTQQGRKVSVHSQYY
jgi:hypothetical protein